LPIWKSSVTEKRIMQKHLAETEFKAHFIVGIILVITLKLILYSVVSLSIPDYLPWGYLSRAMLWLWLLLIWLYVRYIEKKPFLLLKEEKRSSLFFYITSIIILMAVMIGLNLIPDLFNHLEMQLADMHVQAEMEAYQHERPFLLIITAFTGGIVEEMVFRAYMLPRLYSILTKKWAAVLISSILYAALYYTYGTWLNMLIPFLTGIVFGYFYMKYRSISILLIAHISALLILGAIHS